MKIILKKFDYNGVSYSVRFIPDLVRWWSFWVPAEDIALAINLPNEGDLQCGEKHKTSLAIASKDGIFGDLVMLAEFGVYQSVLSCESNVAECFYDWLWSGVVKSVRDEMAANGHPDN